MLPVPTLNSISYASIFPFKKVHVNIIFLSLLWKYRSYDHFSMPTYFPTTLYIYLCSLRSVTRIIGNRSFINYILKLYLALNKSLSIIRPMTKNVYLLQSSQKRFHGPVDQLQTLAAEDSFRFHARRYGICGGKK